MRVCVSVREGVRIFVMDVFGEVDKVWQNRQFIAHAAQTQKV